MNMGMCKIPGCAWTVLEAAENIAQAAAVWHVYEDHPDIWAALAGDRPPRGPDPRNPAVRSRMLAEAGFN